jgi:His/Glu/Gln/Arg/opine family amino acid ABC transporter permease subunit
MGVLSFDDTGYGDELLVGASITVKLAVFSFIIAFFLGLVLSSLALSRNVISRWLWNALASVMMGVPSILVVFFIYYNSSLILEQIFGTSPEITPFIAGVTGLSIVYSVYVGEAIRGAVINTDRGQFDAAKALGLRRWMMWFYIILPQVFRLALPGLTNIWMVVLKDTALVSMVGLSDLVRVADVAAAVTKQPFIFYLFVGFAYIIFSSATMLIARQIEKRVNRGQQLAGGF